MDKYIFLDRDGVINKDPAGWTKHGYVTCWENFQFLPGVLGALKNLSDEGYESVIISNQQGVGKGYFTREDLDNVTAEMSRVIEKAGGNVTRTYYCTHAKEENCECRKPKKGLFHIAQEELGIQDFGGKFFVGDTERDMQAGKEVGLKTVLVLSGKSSREDAGDWEYKPDHICEDLAEAVDLIIALDNDG
jgi:histidinol-phosphate phosphatase family protein